MLTSRYTTLIRAIPLFMFTLSLGYYLTRPENALITTSTYWNYNSNIHLFMTTCLSKKEFLIKVT